MSLFTAAEIEYFYQVRNATYRRGVPDDKQMGERLFNGIWEGTRLWAEAVGQEAPDFIVEFGKYWQKSGWDNGNRVAEVKPYTWARILRPQDKGKGIYFTIGVDAGRQSLLTKVHYQEEGRQESVLTAKQKQVCKELIFGPDGWYNYWREIPLEQVEDYSLAQLTADTLNFIQQYESTYDLIVKIVWKDTPTTLEDTSDLSSGETVCVAESTSPALTGRSYLRPEQLVEPTYIHRLVCNQLANSLRRLPDAGEISLEWVTAHNMRVDLVHRWGNELTFYEIKVYPSLRACIREAVGQLLDYAYWPGHNPPTELIIVTPLPPDDETSQYMTTLRVALLLPIWYQQFDMERKTLGGRV